MCVCVFSFPSSLCMISYHKNFCYRSGPALLLQGPRAVLGRRPPAGLLQDTRTRWRSSPSVSLSHTRSSKLSGPARSLPRRLSSDLRVILMQTRGAIFEKRWAGERKTFAFSSLLTLGTTGRALGEQEGA